MRLGPVLAESAAGQCQPKLSRTVRRVQEPNSTKRSSDCLARGGGPGPAGRLQEACQVNSAK